MIVRREGAADAAAARAVQVEAFRAPHADDEPVEAQLLDALRDCDGWLPALSIVAVLDDSVVGHVVTTRGFIGDVPALGLGPIGVLPSRQGHGIGLALMHATIGAADALGEPLIALLGSPGYYARFGFGASITIGKDTVAGSDLVGAARIVVSPLPGRAGVSLDYGDLQPSGARSRPRTHRAHTGGHS